MLMVKAGQLFEGDGSAAGLHGRAGRPADRPAKQSCDRFTTLGDRKKYGMENMHRAELNMLASPTLSRFSANRRIYRHNRNLGTRGQSLHGGMMRTTALLRRRRSQRRRTRPSRRILPGVNQRFVSLTPANGRQ